MATPTVLCLAINHENKPIGMLFKVILENNIINLRDKVKEEIPNALKDVDARNLVVWRCKEEQVFDDEDSGKLDLQVRAVFSKKEVTKLSGTQKINELKLADSEVLLIQVPVHNVANAKKRGVEVEHTVAKRLKFDGAQERDVEAARIAPPPSSVAPLQAFGNEQEKRPVLNGRPLYNSGLPVGLFHPVFNSFHAATRSQEYFKADAKTYSAVRALFGAFADIYTSKEERIAAIDRHLVPLLGSSFDIVVVQGFKSDGVIMQPCGFATAYLVIREFKNEIGTGHADPYNQASLSYRKYWADPSRDAIRNSCHCPSIILAIAGPWLCVIGGVYLQKAVIQPLTDYIWLGGDSFNEDRLLFASRLFTALKSAISALRSYYTALGQELANPVSQNPVSDAFPFITEYGSKKFTYVSRLASPNKLVYKAELDNEHRMVVVKFVSTYHAQAHRILAKHRLAPTLHYASTDHAEAPKYGGRCMIVMDFIEGKPAVGSLSEGQFEQVKEAIQLLHSHDFVFGDLRPPNILITDDTAMLIDFDWCGKAEEAQYPASLNTADNIGWPTGVEPDSVMRKEHDIFLLQKLQSHNT